MGNTSRSYKIFLIQPKRGWLRALKLQRRKVWQIVVYHRGKYEYLCTTPPNPTLNVVLKRIKQKYEGNIMSTKRNPDRIKVTSMMLAKDVEALMDGHVYAGDLWIRLSKGKPFLCICDGYKIVKTLCYVSRENLLRFLYASSDEQCIEIANSLSNKFKIWPRTRVEDSIEDYGVKAELAEKETWGDEYRIDEELEGYGYRINLIETARQKSRNNLSANDATFTPRRVNLKC